METTYSGPQRHYLRLRSGYYRTNLSDVNGSSFLVQKKYRSRSPIPGSLGIQRAIWPSLQAPFYFTFTTADTQLLNKSNQSSDCGKDIPVSKKNFLSSGNCDTRQPSRETGPFRRNASLNTVRTPKGRAGEGAESGQFDHTCTVVVETKTRRCGHTHANCTPITDKGAS